MSQICQITGNLSKNCLLLVNLCQSGEISPNLVTLNVNNINNVLIVANVVTVTNVNILLIGITNALNVSNGIIISNVIIVTSLANLDIG